MMNNHSVPDFEMDDDYALPTSSGLTRPKKSPMAEDEIMELLWQNGQVVMQSQNQRSLKKSHLSSGGGGGGSGDAVIPSEQAAGREIRPVNETTTTTQQHMFMQEDEMASWLHYPLDDSSFDYADLLYPPPSAPITTAAPPPREFRTVEIRQPPPLPTQPSTASAPISVAQRPPPVPPARRTGGAAETAPPRFQNFGHFSRLPSRNSTTKIELPPSKSLKESTVVDSNDTPILESKFSNVADNIPAISAATAATSTVPVREPTETTATTCELTVTSSPGCSGNSVSASAEPPSQVPSQTTATVPSGVVAEDRKRKGRENDDGECQNEDAEFESADTKKQARCSTSTKRSRAAEVHNLSERRRRDRINEKMRALQELIPRCNKTDKASMLDEAIEYLKSLQLQVQMMSMGCGMVPMMYPGMQQYIPTMGMGLGMGMGMEIGMNRPMVPYPPLLPGTAMQNAAAAAQMGPRFPMPPFHLQAVPVPDPSRVQTSNQPDPMLNPLVTHNPNHPRLQNYNDPYQQFFGLQAQVALPQNQAVEQPKNNRTGSSKEVGNPGNHQSG